MEADAEVKVEEKRESPEQQEDARHYHYWSNEIEKN